MSNVPPLGYDDSTIIPKERLFATLGKIEEILADVEPWTEQRKHDLDASFLALAGTADELDIAHLEVISRVFEQYHHFQDSPYDHLDFLQAEVENLKTYLILFIKNKDTK